MLHSVIILFIYINCKNNAFINTVLRRQKNIDKNTYFYLISLRMKIKKNKTSFASVWEHSSMSVVLEVYTKYISNT